MRIRFHELAKRDLDDAIDCMTIDADTINIWAIAHMHRKPGYWQNRH